MTFDYHEYRDFIANKGVRCDQSGFEPEALPPRLFEHQRRAVDFACEKGKAALFLDTGLGKSGCEAVFADESRRQTNKPSLILTPLAVAKQMQRECEAFGVDARVVREADDVWSGVNIANYERISKIDVSKFGCIVLDESSILKAFAGSTKRMLVEAFNATPYRMAATATPAPNDHMELGNHSEFLSVMGSMEMLCRWFINDTSTASQNWRLKRHAEHDFWSWVASWARAAAMPSDLGGDDAAFELPPLITKIHECDVDLTDGAEDTLFRMPDNSATNVHKEKKLTLDARCNLSAEIANSKEGSVIVWCERADESKLLTKLIPDAVEVIGSMKPDEKERRLEAFTFGQARVIVTKPRIAGFGLNWQRAKTQVFSSITHSYERYYQAIRRSWRFGQNEEVTAHIVISQTERPMWRNVVRKAADHDKMKRAMSYAMREAQTDSHKRIYTRPPEITLPAFARQ